MEVVISVGVGCVVSGIVSLTFELCVGLLCWCTAVVTAGGGAHMGSRCGYCLGVVSRYKGDRSRCTVLVEVVVYRVCGGK
jgi:hypothetical protein